jgi:hypothetical protein
MTGKLATINRKDDEVAIVPPEGQLYRQLLHTSFMIQDSRSVGCHLKWHSTENRLDHDVRCHKRQNTTHIGSVF